MINQAAADVVYALRTAFKNPAYASVVILTLAIGIGATGAVFAVVDAILLRPLPLHEPDRVFMGYGAYPDNNRAGVAAPNYLDYRANNSTLEQLAAIAGGPSLELRGPAGVERVASRFVTDNFFAALGAQPVVGRGFTADETVDGGPRVVVISHSLWQQQFAADPDVVGRTINLNGEPADIVGVAPAGLRRVLGAVAIWRPLQLSEQLLLSRTTHGLLAIARLAPGVGITAAQEDLDAVAAELGRLYPETNTDWTLAMVPLLETVVGSVRAPLTLIGWAGLAVLAIACCNAAVVTLARATGRTSEVALRVALGASSGRVARLLLTESVVLSAIGGALGMVASWYGVAVLRATAGGALPRTQELGVDLRVLAVSFAGALLAGVLFGLVPALGAARGEVFRRLGGGKRSSPSRRTERAQRLLVVGQVATSLLLLVGAALLLRSLQALQRVDPGFAADDVLTASFRLPETRYPDADDLRAFYGLLQERLDAVPGIVAHGAANAVPFDFNFDEVSVYFETEGGADERSGSTAQLRMVAGDYFQAMSIPFLAGSRFDQTQAEDTRVALVDEGLARALFPGEDAIGQRVKIPRNGVRIAVEIVGIVGDVKHFGFDSPAFGTMYLPQVQFPTRDLTVVLDGRGDRRSAAAEVRQIFADLDPNLPTRAGAMTEILQDSTADARFRTFLIGLFATVALLLAAVGLYGVLAYSVSQRRHEIGVRVALGASRGDILRHVMMRGLTLVALGLGVGFVASLALGQTLRNLLFDVNASDPVAVIVSVTALLLIGVLASWLPALRATRSDPVAAIRGD